MKLTIEHLAPYLPYGLKVFNVDSEIELIDFMAIKSDDYSINVCHNDSGDVSEWRIQDITPILRPLSDLTDEIEHNGERFVPIFELFQIAYESIYGYRFDGVQTILSSEYLAAQFNEDGWSYGFTVELPNQFLMSANGDYLTIPNFNMYNKLHQWHFDTFGLLESGLAIDINTIK